MMKWAALGLAVLLAGCSEPAPDPTKSTANSSDRTLIIKSYYNDVMTAITPCDQANTIFVDTLNEAKDLGAAGLLAAHDGATQSDDICRISAENLERVAVPTGLPGKADEQLATAKSGCIDVMRSRREGYRIAKDMFDGDMKASNMAAFRDQQTAAQAAGVRCVANLFAGAAEAGVEASVLQPDKK